MYYIYKIAYKISDEIVARKEAEKPFWWEHLHPEVKELSIEEIEKGILEAGTPAEKLAEMTKHEKYLAVSEGCYVIDSKEALRVSQELESLKSDVERNKASFVPTQPVQESFDPIPFGNPAPSIPSAIPGAIPSAIPNAIPPGLELPGESSFSQASPGTPTFGTPANQTDHFKIDDEHLKILASNVRDSDLKDDERKPFGGSLSGESAIGSTPGKAEIRKYAQSIVSKTVSDINANADRIPDDVAMMKEQELLQAVIDELKSLR